MEVTKELIAKFFRQECTPEETMFISDYFDQHPDELDKYMSVDDWQNFEAEAELHPAVSKKMLQNIEDSIAVKPRVDKKNLKILMAAASIIFIIGTCLFIGGQITRTHKLANLSLAQANDTVINKTGKELAIALPDGSEVMLSTKSRFCYNKAFNQKHRDIYLSGEAVFKVAKDKTRPFTVYASGLATTALGTRFKVSAFNNESQVSVKLYEGKVVIKHMQSVNAIANSDVYLTPGHELQWDNDIKKGHVTVFNNLNQSSGSPARAADSKPAKSTIKFNNERLENVINLLQQIYNIRIKVIDGSLDNKFFTGSVDYRTETADDVLSIIAKLNKLSLKKQGDTYTLSSEAIMPADSAARLKRDE